MLVLPQTVKVKKNGSNKKRFDSIGLEPVNGYYTVNVEDLSKGSSTLVNVECDGCGVIYSKRYEQAIRSKKDYCSVNCRDESRRLERECEQCNGNYVIQQNLKDISRFCSKQCLQDWQKINFKGEKSSKYVKPTIINCFWCEKEIERRPYKLKTNKYHFCSVECSDSHLREVQVKLPERIERSREIALDNLKNGVFKTDSAHQLIVNDILNELGVEYVNEHIDGYFSFDNYLNELDLYIEVMGTFWHCDARVYNKISYKNQIDRIISDKKKLTYIKGKYNKKILYLWESDIEDNYNLCMLLIDKFIKQNGKIKNYHSFNYSSENGEIKLNKEIVKPYMSYTSKEIYEIFDPEVKDKLSRKDPTKHIIFECDQCGKQSEQPIIQYMTSEKHFCNKECKSKYFRHNERFEYPCHYCGEKVLVKRHVHLNFANGKRDRIFCDVSCKGKWESESRSGINHPLYSSIVKNCGYCEAEFIVKKARKDSAKFCSHECRQKASIRRVQYKCDGCQKDCETTPSKYKRSTNHFCSHECADNFNASKRRKRRVEKSCEICKEKFEVIESLSSQRFCSTSCQGIWQSQHLVGENANNYQGKGFSKHI